MKKVNGLMIWKRAPVPALAAVADQVAPNGNDAGSGDTSTPFATIERARLAVRERAPAMSEDIHVHIHAGDYLRDRPLQFTPEDSQQTTEKAIIIGRSASRQGTNQLRNYENQLTH